MDETQCKLFSNGFQLIDKFITTIESKTPTKPDDQPSRPADAVTPPSRKENDILMDDPEYGDAVMPMPEERSGALGSKTWSSQPDQGPQLLEVQNFLVASLTPSPPASFQPPTPPPAPPLAFPTMQSLIIPPLLSIDKLLQMKIDPVIRRQRRDVDWDIVDLEPDIMTIRRVKRDYYDDTKDSESPESSTSSSSSSTPSPPSAPDYYGGVAESSPSRHRDESTPLQNCVHILGLY
ncbi:hypothetical protein GCK32_009253 [Trichostrongylus colubriformis]|uniref:Uncharacterized protein n=1 Tax=Trichostrongylus colubriformis TaxID=6319 RepID=A0AAN8G1N4_TRICO